MIKGSDLDWYYRVATHLKMMVSQVMTMSVPEFQGWVVFLSKEEKDDKSAR